MADTLDSVDQEILKILQEDARTTYTSIARQLKLSESTIRHRVTRLESSGVIKKYSIIIDPKRIGYHGIALVGLDVDPPKFLEVAMTLTEMPEIRTVTTSTGDHMIMCEIWTRDGAELARFITDRIGALDGVTKICPAIIHERLKI
ncbi:MAG: winged helix-turn-helix transcriptional regulator [Candidatus Ranarchaeia archaeon]